MYRTLAYSTIDTDCSSSSATPGIEVGSVYITVRTAKPLRPAVSGRFPDEA